MIQDIRDRNDSQQANDKQLDVLKEHFPACFKKDGSFDIDRFKAEIADKTDVINEGYELRFLGKSYAKLLASTDTTTIIQPDEVHNSQPENANSENIYISGDNLDGLKHLLKSYQRKIKCIYIDPPYNTGSDGFVYQDNFNYTKENLQEKLNVSEEEAERILDLTRRGSASHSAWLMFMYCRLILARDLLTNDGVIFISIDDNEQANLKLLCDDVFGEENWIGSIVWKNATDNNPTQIAVEHEYVIAFAKSKPSLESEWKSKVSDIKNLLVSKGNELTEKFKDIDVLKEEYNKWYKSHKNELWPLDRYKYIDADGIYTGSQSVHNPGKEGYRYDVLHPGTQKPTKQPLMGYRFPESTMSELLDGGKILFGNDETKIIELKLYAKDYSAKLSSVIEFDGRIGAYDLKEVFSDSKTVFTNPKPVKFINQFISFILKNDKDVVLDFFSGSASTAHAVLDLNATDGISRKFIAIQIPAQLDTTVASQKLTLDFLKENNLPQTLDYIGIERIKRAAAKIKDQYPDKKLDLGFKHYMLIEPNQNTLDKLDSFDKSALIVDTNIIDDFGKPSILATWLNADGYGLTVEVKVVDLAGYTAYYHDKHLYLIDPGFGLESMKALLSKYDGEGDFNPENLVLFGYSFPDWSINEMVEKNLRVLNDSEKNLKINLTVRY